ncbi:RHS repeat-associated core domain-containing protein [Parabacteroides goldsteinii]|uniref:RHS repeat-associated core domain-containing protein n=1 Tax=Parabacteroides goldsteinii TaxID=328812 RepID=UPI003AF12F39
MLTIMLSALAFVSMGANDCGRSCRADIGDSLCNLIRGDYSLHESIFRTPDKVGNLYREAECKGRKYDRGGRLLWDGEYHYSYDCEGNLVHKSRRNINAGTAGNGQPGDTGGKKKAGWFRLLFGSDGTGKDDRRETNNNCTADPFMDWEPGDTCYRWHANGMLAEVRTPDGKVVSFGYDALGRRVSKRTCDTLHRFGWDGNVVLHEWDTEADRMPRLVKDETGREEYDGTEKPENLVTWVYDGTSFTPVAKVTEEERYTIVHDYLGTPTQAYDSNGELVWEMLLDVYGEVAQCHGDRSLVPFRYQGQYEDVETGLFYNRFRYYSPQMGMYISSDPIGLAGGNPTLYGYVFDSNIEIDLLGEKPSKINRHHLIPQEMFRNPDFMNQLKNIGIKDPADFVHRQVSDITEALHKQIHNGAGGGKWNMEFRDWFENNQNFSKKDLQTQIRKMMHNHKIPRSSRNFARKYGRKCK